MSDFTLQDIRDAAAKRYRGMKIDLGDGATVELRNVLRLNDEETKRLNNLQDRDPESMTEQFDQVREMISILADNSAGANRLIEAFRDDNAALLQLMNEWKRITQVGEAEPSQS